LVEQAIFSCIGFLVAALLAVAATPALSRRARRLAEARARLQAPLSEAQAVAERDALRAEHAVDRFRMEQRLRTVEDVASERLIEIGRQTNRILALEAEVAAFPREELTAAQREALELRGELSAAHLELRDLTRQRDAADAACAASVARGRDLAVVVDEHRATIAALQTRIAALEARLEDGERAAAAAAKAAEAERARLAAAVDEAETLLKRSEAAREDVLLENGRQLARLAEREAALSEAEAARRDLDERLSALAAEAEARENAAAARAQTLVSAQAVLEGALSAERAERAELQREVERLRARPAGAGLAGRAEGDHALRKAIARLGRDVARLTGKASAAGEPPDLVGFDRRDNRGHAGAGEAMPPPPTVMIGEGRP